VSALDEVLVRGATPLITGLRFRHRDGTWRIVEGSAVRIVESDGKVSLVTTGRDVTERIQLEAQLHRAQKMEAIGRLASGVAHDFNDLLTVILGYSNLLLEQLDENRVLHQEVAEIKRAADRGAILTQQLLTFGRKQVLSLRPVDLNPIIGAQSGPLRQLIGEGVELKLKLAADLAPTRVDPGQIEQMIMSLAANARDAMPRGGLLSIETANLELDAASARRCAVQPGPYVMLAVTDTGHGMDAATQARLFEPFFTTKEPGKGTGMGLATVYGIVKQSAGAISVYSEPGCGTTFRIYLPRVAEEPTAAVVETLAARPSSSGSETILIAEDEPAVRGFARRTLEELGYTVLEATGSVEALTIAAAHAGPIALLVTDVVMPGLPGPKLAEKLEAARPKLRTLYVSGFTAASVISHGVPEYGIAFLAKPFSADALGHAVRAVLDQLPR
jgi:signal transduction histidine kinase/CheY-like chemotaxis protein